MSLFKDCGIPPGHDELGYETESFQELLQLLLQPGQTDQRNMAFRRQVLPWGIESRLIEAHGPIDGKTYGTPMPGQKGPFSPQKMHLPAGQHLMLEPMPAAARLHEGNYMMLMLATGVLGTAFAWARLALKI